MEEKRSRRSARILRAVLAFLLMLAVVCAADPRMPETGSKTKKGGGLTVDYSHIDEGYVMVKAKQGSKKLKLRVKMGKTTLTYNLNNKGEYEVIPMQLGNGSYNFILYKNVSGNKYSEEGKVSLKASMPDELSAFLYPNQYVNYTADCAAVLEAQKLCEGVTDQEQIFKIVCDYMKTNFVYDYIKAVTVQPGQLPQIDECWEKRMGICQDLAAVMVCMLRSQGVPAKLMIGMLNESTYHAWVTVVVNGEEKFYDPTAALNAVSKGSYTVERFY